MIIYLQPTLCGRAEKKSAKRGPRPRSQRLELCTHFCKPPGLAPPILCFVRVASGPPGYESIYICTCAVQLWTRRVSSFDHRRLVRRLVRRLSTAVLVPSRAPRHDGHVRVRFEVEAAPRATDALTESQGGATTPKCPRRPPTPRPALQGRTGPHGSSIVPFRTVAVTASAATNSCSSQDSWPRGGRCCKRPLMVTRLMTSRASSRPGRGRRGQGRGGRRRATPTVPVRAVGSKEARGIRPAATCICSRPSVQYS